MKKRRKGVQVGGRWFSNEDTIERAKHRFRRKVNRSIKKREFKRRLKEDE